MPEVDWMKWTTLSKVFVGEGSQEHVLVLSVADQKPHFVFFKGNVAFLLSNEARGGWDFKLVE